MAQRAPHIARHIVRTPQRARHNAHHNAYMHDTRTHARMHARRERGTTREIIEPVHCQYPVRTWPSSWYHPSPSFSGELGRSLDKGGGEQQGQGRDRAGADL